MHALGDYAATNHVAKHNFVSIAEADELRQQGITEEFRKRYPEQFQRAVDAVVASRAAAQELKLAQQALIQLCPQQKISDLLKSVDEIAQTTPAMPKPTVLEPAPVVSVAIEDAGKHSPAEAKTVTDNKPTKFGGKKLAGAQSRQK